TEPPPDLVQQPVRHRLVALAELESLEERARVTDGQRRRLDNGAAGHLHVVRLAAQPRAAARRARLVAAVAAQEDADVHLVLLLLERLEEAAHTRERPVALDNEP